MVDFENIFWKFHNKLSTFCLNRKSGSEIYQCGMVCSKQHGWAFTSNLPYMMAHRVAKTPIMPSVNYNAKHKHFHRRATVEPLRDQRTRDVRCCIQIYCSPLIIHTVWISTQRISITLSHVRLTYLVHACRCIWFGLYLKIMRQ